MYIYSDALTSEFCHFENSNNPFSKIPFSKLKQSIFNTNNPFSKK